MESRHTSIPRTLPAPKQSGRRRRAVRRTRGRPRGRANGANDDRPGRSTARRRPDRRDGSRGSPGVGTSRVGGLRPETLRAGPGVGPWRRGPTGETTGASSATRHRSIESRLAISKRPGSDSRRAAVRIETIAKPRRLGILQRRPFADSAHRSGVRRRGRVAASWYPDCNELEPFSRQSFRETEARPARVLRLRESRGQVHFPRLGRSVQLLRREGWKQIFRPPDRFRRGPVRSVG